jgi:hypothetical protein
MTIEVRTVTAYERRELERLVHQAVSQGWQCVGTPAQVTYNGTMPRLRWQQPMRRK